ncbi:MAG TPA: hypothetical protein VF158_09265 [Longimicrobiales bacterium]
MRRTVLIASGALCLLAGAGALHAQDSIPWPAANRLDVTVTARVTEVRGDTLRLTYTVANAAGSEQAAQTFVVRTYLPDYTIASPRLWMGMRGMVQDSAAAHWFSIATERFIVPGDSLGGFVFEGVGLLDIVPYRVQGYYDLPAYDDSQPWRIARPPSFWVNSVPGVTIGIKPIPDALPADALLERLRDLTGRSCAEPRWIDNAGVCRSLLSKLDAALRALERENTGAARAQVESFLAELEAQHGEPPGKHVNDTAYWLLRTNAEHVLGRL